MSYWAPNGTLYNGGSTAHVQAPLTTLPVFQRHGSVVPQIELDDETVLVLRTHDGGTAHRGGVYDDDGITTNAQLREEFFLLRTETRYGDEVTLTARVEHAVWRPTWRHIRWEVSGPSVEGWESVHCGGAALPRASTDTETRAEASGWWSVVEGAGKASVVLPLTAEAGWELSCVAR